VRFERLGGAGFNPWYANIFAAVWPLARQSNLDTKRKTNNRPDKQL